MDIRKLQRAIVDGLEDVKAQDIVVYNTERLSPLFERVVIASGTSNRQTKALASSVRETVKKRGLRVLSTEGEANGEWIIVDCGAAVAHIMQPAIREYYHLEEIWGGKPVTMKTAAAAARLPKAAEPAPSKSVRTTTAALPVAKAAARRAGAGRAPAQGVPAKATSAKATSARRAPAERAPAENARATKAAPRRAATGPAPAKARVAKKAAARKPEPRKPEPRKPEPRKPEPRKPEPRKPEPRKPEPRKPEPRKPAPRKPAPRKPAVEALAQPAGKSARPAARKAPRS
ncbi:MAG: ribosome silencing factor [Rubrivivax sp.]